MILKIKADTLGIISGSICLIHCLATPFLFLAKTCSINGCADVPAWWGLIDYLFLIVSFCAIYYTTKKSTKKWVSISLWFSWGLLFLIIINETSEIFSLPESLIYIPAFSIIALHLYNLKYGKCLHNHPTEPNEN